MGPIELGKGKSPDEGNADDKGNHKFWIGSNQQSSSRQNEDPSISCNCNLNGIMMMMSSILARLHPLSSLLSLSLSKFVCEEEVTSIHQTFLDWLTSL